MNQHGAASDVLMKRSVSFALLAALWTSTSAVAQGWCPEDEDGFYEEPYYEVVVPLSEVIFDLIRGHLERRAEPRERRRPVWEEPRWVPPRAQRPRTAAPKEQPRVRPPSNPQPRRVTADYKPPVPPVMPERKPKQEVEIELTPEPETRTVPEVAPVRETEVDVKMAVPVPGAPGFVFSPFDGEKRKVDVRGLPPGSMARDPYTKEIFRVP